MAKARTPIPPSIAAEVMFRHDRTCCVCQVAGLSVQIHHIDEDPTNHAPSNLAVLCFQDHELTQTRGGFGRKLGPEEVRLSRNNWVAAVALRRERAEEARLQAMIGPPRASPHLASISCRDPELAAYLESLPSILAAAHTLAADKWTRGNTYEQREAVSAVIQTVRECWLRLAAFFPAGTFGDDPDVYLQKALEHRSAWHSRLLDYEGTIWPLLIARRVLSESQRMVADTVFALAGLGANAQELDSWLAAWEEAGARAER
jgi:hypothetical protein